MPWYSYVFFILAALAFFVGCNVNAKKRNGIGFVHALILTGVWLGLGLWTGGFL